MNQKLGRILAAVLLPLLLVGGCIGLTQTVTPPTTASAPATETVAGAAKPLAGGEFNKFFPKPGDGYDVVFVQEKAGFAQANLNQGGENLAQLSINDAIGDTKSLAKYEGATLKISGYPAAQIGNSRTALLVGDRFQVSAISKSEAFGVSDRASWLKKFDLAGLAALQ